LTFTVILVTLVGGGLTLPAVISALHVGDDGDEEAEDVRRAIVGVAKAALEKVDALERDGRIDAGHADVLRRRYEHEKLVTQNAGQAGAAEEIQRHRQAEREVIDAQREALIQLRERGEIDNAVLRRVLNSLDLADRRLKG